MSKTRLTFPAASRNQEPILRVLETVVRQGARVLELASGSGQHATYFAANLPVDAWTASDIDASKRDSVAAWVEHLSLTHVQVIDVDAEQHPWDVPKPLDLVVNINMIHIAPWSVCQGLMRGAADVLKPDGILFMYGPFARGGRHNAPSNEAFDASLRERDPAWGVRDLDDVTQEAEQRGLVLTKTVEMPANNLSVIFQKGR